MALKFIVIVEVSKDFFVKSFVAHNIDDLATSIDELLGDVLLFDDLALDCLLLDFVIFNGLLDLVPSVVCWNLVHQSSHQSPKDHLLVLGDNAFSLEFVGLRSDVGKNHKLGKQHIMELFNVLKNLKITKFGTGILFEFNSWEENIFHVNLHFNIGF